MKRVTTALAALCGITLLLNSSGSAQNKYPTPTAESGPQTDTSFKTDKPADTGAGNATGEVEGLKRRVEELEKQNRALARSLADINAKLSALARPETASAVATPVAQPVASAAVRPAAPAKQEEKDPYVRWSEILGEGNRFKLYGFLRLDLDFDSQRPSNAQIPFFITSPDARAGARATAHSTSATGSRRAEISSSAQTTCAGARTTKGCRAASTTA
jgi:hypothetical protein